MKKMEEEQKEIARQMKIREENERIRIEKQKKLDAAINAARKNQCVCGMSLGSYTSNRDNYFMCGLCEKYIPDGTGIYWCGGKKEGGLESNGCYSYFCKPCGDVQYPKGGGGGGGGCFAYGTKFIVQNQEDKVIEKQLEDIKYGDKVLIHDLYENFSPTQKARFETVVFVDLDPPGSAPSWRMTKITLEDGSSLEVTDEHRVPILNADDTFTELRADQVKEGDKLVSASFSG